MADAVGAPNTNTEPDRSAFIRTYAKDRAAIQRGDVKPVVEPALTPPITLAIPAVPPVAPAPTPDVSPPVNVARIPATSVSPEQAREAVLARLRGRVGMPAAPVPRTPLVSSVPAGLGTNDARIPSPVSPGARVVPPPRSEGPSPLHTYKSDFAEHVGDTGASRFSILAAEQDARGTPAPKTETAAPSPRKSVLFAGLGIFLFLAGGAGTYIAYQYYAAGTTAPSAEPSIASLIFADERTELTDTGAGLMKAFVASARTSLPEGGVRIVYLASTTPNGKQFVSGDRFMRALGLPAPDILLRNIEPESTVGVIHAVGETRAFFILKVSSYDATFRGMLDWETSVDRDLVLLYPAYQDAVATSSLAATSPPATVTTLVSQRQFSDEIVSSNDVRVLRDAKGRSILLYGYRDKTTLIIARDPAAFSELASRLSATRQE